LSAVHLPNYQFIQVAFTFFFAASYVKGKLDLHIESGFVYWADNSTSTSYKGIHRAKIDGGSYSTVLNSGVGKGGIQGLAVDWVAGMKPPNFPVIHPLSLQIQADLQAQGAKTLTRSCIKKVGYNISLK